MSTVSREKLFAALCLSMGMGVLCALSMTVMADDLPTKTVHYADLDLSNPAGAKALYGRIRVAAKQVCEFSIDRDAVLQTPAHECIDKAIDGAVRAVNSPVLTALRFGTAAPARLASR